MIKKRDKLHGRTKFRIFLGEMIRSPPKPIYDIERDEPYLQACMDGYEMADYLNLE